MGALTTITLTPEGMSPLQCRCGQNLTLDQEKALGSCLLQCSCGHAIIDRFTCGSSINPADAHFLDDAEVFAATWYHLTDRADWQGESLTDAGDETLMVHLGTLDAAIEREAESYGADRDFPLYIYEVMLRPGTPINYSIAQDVDVWPEEVGECAEEWAGAFFEVGINRYVNVVESAGSISLLVDARCVQVLTRHEV